MEQPLPTVELELETYSEGIAIFAANVQGYGRFAVELRMKAWQQLGRPGVIRVMIGIPAD